MISTNTIFYAYDSAILSWLQGLNFSESVYGSGFDPATETVDVVWSSVNPFFAAPKTAETYRPDRVANYPIISLDSADPELDPSRRMVGDIYNYDSVTSGGVQKVKKVRHPLAFKVPYQIDLYARHSGHIKQMYMKLLLEFQSNYKYLTITLPDPIKSKYCKLTLKDIVDNSDLELDQEGQTQLYRKTISIDADIWLFGDEYPTLIDRVSRIDIEYTNTSDISLDEDVIYASGDYVGVKGAIGCPITLTSSVRDSAFYPNTTGSTVVDVINTYNNFKSDGLWTTAYGAASTSIHNTCEPLGTDTLSIATSKLELAMNTWINVLNTAGRTEDVNSLRTKATTGVFGISWTAT